MAGRQLTQITDAIIHHSAGPTMQTALEIDAEHRDRGMSMIGYNYIINALGEIYAGRPLEFVPSAAFGRNTESVNVCVLGNFELDDPGYTGLLNPSQLKALQDLLVYLHHQLPTIVRTIGHCDVATMFYPNDTANYSTACPGSKLYNLIPSIKKYISGHLSSL